MIKYQVEEYNTCIKELSSLYPEHYEELSIVKEHYLLEPDYETYKKIADCGLLKLITVRDDSSLIGYIMLIVTPSLHYKSCKIAVEDLYFLKKEYRKGRIGIEIFKFMEKEMLALGVNKIALTTKVHLDNSKLFEYLGYSFSEKTFVKMIGV